MTADPPNQPDRVRIRNIGELAKLAGVSAGTVSRALANKSLVNTETRDRIQALARQHGFRPNQMASKLRTQRSGVIGVVVPLGHEPSQHISDPFFMTLLGHLADGLTENNYDLMLSRVRPDDPDWLDRVVDSGMLEGVLLIGQSDQFDAIERVAARYRPLVVWGEYRTGQQHCVVGTDNYAGGRLAAQQLIDRGCKHLAYLGDTRPPEIAERFRGARARAAQAGLAEIEVLPAHLTGEVTLGDVAAHVAQLHRRIDGIVAASDVIAMTAIRVLADHSIAVPDQIAVVGFDDLPIATQTVPRMTTVRQDIARGGREMVDALFRRLNGDAAPSVVMPPELIVRDSA